MEERRRSFPEERRLKTRSDFDLVMRTAHGVSEGSVVVYARPADRNSPSRLGLVVGRKASPKAVARNRIKRRLREAFRLSDSLAEGLDIVVVAGNDAPAGMPFAELKERLETLTRKSLARGPKPDRP